MGDVSYGKLKFAVIILKSSVYILAASFVKTVTPLSGNCVIQFILC